MSLRSQSQPTDRRLAQRGQAQTEADKVRLVVHRFAAKKIWIDDKIEVSGRTLSLLRTGSILSFSTDVPAPSRGSPCRSRPAGSFKFPDPDHRLTTASDLQFLSQLSPIDAFEPRPPAPAAVSKAELAGWWREHETIETEVHEFDYGDMTKMKALAMGKLNPMMLSTS